MTQLFAIRHNGTGNLLPAKFKGASWWEGEGDLYAPRLFNLKGAMNFIRQWKRGRVVVRSPQWGLGDPFDDGPTHEIEDRGRKGTDLSVIPVQLSFGDPL